MSGFEICLVFLVIVAIVLIIFGGSGYSLMKGLFTGGLAAMPFETDIEKATMENSDWRRVLYTAEGMQVVVMNVPAGMELGREVHKENDQLFRIESGNGRIVMDNGADRKSNSVNGNKPIGQEIFNVSGGSLVVIPRGVYHNVINDGNADLKFYTVYSPPHHPAGIVDKTKTDEILREH